MSTNHTPNYSLSQWEATDPVLRADFNADNAKIDAALGAHAAALAGKGNCQIYTTGYSGNGGVGPANARSLTFPKWPRLILIIGEKGFLLIFPGITTGYSVTTSSVLSVTTSWSGNTISWYGGSLASVMMNSSNIWYSVVALMDTAQ